MGCARAGSIAVSLSVAVNWLISSVANFGVPSMKGAKQKTITNAEASQLDRVQRLVDSGRYPTMSAFVREAIEEKPRRIEQDRVADAVERYCAAGHADEDLDLIATQAIEGTRGSGKASRPRRGAR